MPAKPDHLALSANVYPHTRIDAYLNTGSTEPFVCLSIGGLTLYVSLEASMRLAEQVAAALREVPAVATVSTPLTRTVCAEVYCLSDPMDDTLDYCEEHAL